MFLPGFLPAARQLLDLLFLNAPMSARARERFKEELSRSGDGMGHGKHFCDYAKSLLYLYFNTTP